MKYQYYGEITKDILNTIKVGDLIKINEWKKPMRVVGVSDNYFCMIMKVAGKVCYSVCEKKAWQGIKYNAMIGGMFHCSTDNMVFGYDISYKFDNDNEIKRYLQAFEDGKIGLSYRNAVPIFKLYIK